MKLILFLFSKYHTKFQKQLFSPGFPNSNMSPMLEAEDVLSKLETSCLGKSFCEFGFHSNMNLDDEISVSVQESIR